MKHNAMKTVWQRALLAVTLVVTLTGLTSCDTEQYKVEDGKVYWHQWTFSFGPQDYELTDVDLPSFRDMPDGYAHDHRHAWYREHLLEGANGSTFRYLKNGYATDGHRVYLMGEQVDAAECPYL